MEGPLLTFKCRKAGKGCKPSRRHYHGARYGQPFSLEFPHFEVSFCNIDNNNQTNIISAGLKATDCVTKQKIVLFADFNKWLICFLIKPSETSNKEAFFFQVYWHKTRHNISCDVHDRLVTSWRQTEPTYNKTFHWKHFTWNLPSVTIFPSKWPSLPFGSTIALTPLDVIFPKATKRPTVQPLITPWVLFFHYDISFLDPMFAVCTLLEFP